MGHKPLSRDDWSQFWRNDTLTTFLGTFGRNYDGEIKEYWCRCFSQLAENARIVDLATGNGALAFLAAQYSKEYNRYFQITALDYAEIDTHKYVNLTENEKILANEIIFHSNTNIENTQLPDHSFDCAISQFGMEYSDLGKTIPELARVLKPNSRFYAILHSEHSLIIKQSKETLEQIDICLEKYKIDQIVTKIIHLFGEISSQEDFTRISVSDAVQDLRSRYNQAIRAISVAVGKYQNKWCTDFLLSSYSNLLGNMQALGNERSAEKLDEIMQEINTYKNRMSDLQYAALDDKGVNNLVDILKKNGFTFIHNKAFYYKKNDLIGVSIDAIYCG